LELEELLLEELLEDLELEELLLEEAAAGLLLEELIDEESWKFAPPPTTGNAHFKATHIST
jgi:hypothetical protein